MSVLTEAQMRQLLNERSVDLTPLSIRAIASRKHRRTQGDVLFELEWADNWRGDFIAEITTASTPRALEAATVTAQRYAGDERYPLVIAPYLSPEALDRCLDREVSAIDLSGNAVIIVPGELAVYRTGFPNKYPASRAIKSIYQGKSSLVPRVFLLQPLFEYVQDIKKEIERKGVSISLGTVSKVLKGLADDLVVQKEPQIALIQPSRLLDRLAEGYHEDRIRVGESVEVKLQLDSEQLWRLRRAAERNGLEIVGGTLGDDDPVPESGPFPIYVERLEPILAELDLPTVRRFATVTLIQSNDPRIYFDRRDREGFYWASPIQRYLELAVGGKREREMSTELRSRILAGLPDG